MTISSPSSPRTPRSARRRRSLAAAALIALSSLAPSPARAGAPIPPEEVPPELKVFDNPKPLLEIPDASDIHLSEAEWAKVKRGEIVVQIVEYSKEDRMARAIGYMKHDPVMIFDVATDSLIAVKNFPEITGVCILRAEPTGKVFYMTVKPSWILPTYEFTSIAEYADPPTGQTFHQIKGDFERNEGVHSYLWDPERQQTLGVFQFAFGLKGILSLVPESLLLSLAKSTLPDAIRKMDTIADGIVKDEPERAAKNAQIWSSLKPRLEAGELPERVWRGPVMATAGPSTAAAAPGAPSAGAPASPPASPPTAPAP